MLITWMVVGGWLSMLAHIITADEQRAFGLMLLSIFWPVVLFLILIAMPFLIGGLIGRWARQRLDEVNTK